MSNSWFWGIILGSIVFNIGIFLIRSRNASVNEKTIIRISIFGFQAMVLALLATFSLPSIYNYYDARVTEPEQIAQKFKQQNEELQRAELDLRHTQIAISLLIPCLTVMMFLLIKEFPNKELTPEEIIGLNLTDDNLSKDI